MRKWEVNFQREEDGKWESKEFPQDQEAAKRFASFCANVWDCFNVNWQASSSSNEKRPCWVVRNGERKNQ